MVTHFAGDALEMRRAGDGAVTLRGTFPYGVPAILTDGGRTGRPQKEVIESRAFAFRVEDPMEDIHLLVGHSFDKPLASKLTGALKLVDSALALTFVATISAAIAATSYGRDALAQIEAGLAVGLSPGFRLPPKRAVADAESMTEEPDDGALDAQGRPQRGAMIRHVKSALLYEMSIVVRPAYPEAGVSMRSMAPARVVRPAALRWR